MGIYTKLVAGSELRKSRLHDEKGIFTGWKNLLLHSGPAVATGALRLAFGYRPELPWISYSAIKKLGSFLNKKCRVLEFGSGMSTVWFGKKAGEVYSIENNKEWYDKVTKILNEKELTNVTYRHADSEEEYARFMSDDTQGFDLIMVDGWCRSKCVSQSLGLLKPTGIYYVDNTDKNSTPAGGDMRIVENMIREYAKETNARIIEYTDFAPTQFFVNQGMMVIRDS